MRQSNNLHTSFRLKMNCYRLVCQMVIFEHWDKTEQFLPAHAMKRAGYAVQTKAFVYHSEDRINDSETMSSSLFWNCFISCHPCESNLLWFQGIIINNTGKWFLRPKTQAWVGDGKVAATYTKSLLVFEIIFIAFSYNQKWLLLCNLYYILCIEYNFILI